MTQEVGAVVTVAGTRYRVAARRSTSGSGAKFYGRFVFTLADAEGKRYTAYGRAVSHNSTLTEVDGNA